VKGWQVLVVEFLKKEEETRKAHQTARKHSDAGSGLENFRHSEADFIAKKRDAKGLNSKARAPT
jgi:adenylylsulfate kinase-like enzyme